MVSSQFESILKDFEAYFKCPLEAGVNDSCIVKMGIGISLQIELNKYGHLLIGCRIIGNMQGRFRDGVIKESLKANGLYPPSTGVFGYSQKSNSLILYVTLDPYRLDADKISHTLTPFIAKAKSWVDTLNKGDIPVVSQEAVSQSPMNSPFEFKR
jgi:hypothetical protein